MPPDGLIRYLHATFAAPRDGVTDRELLVRCASGRDDAAFELLMRRHADLVWRVCRATARDHHAAEDAFQATFLALALKASTVKNGIVAGWLCRVAYHAALKARPRPIASLDHDPPQQSEDRTERLDLGRAMHEELDRLGETYRAPLVLCYLQGLTQAEAARHLGWPIGTVATRVARGRDRLRDRLCRRGIALPAGGLLAVSTAAPASALPLTLVPVIERATASGEGLAPHVHRLTHGALTAMTTSKVWAAATVVVLFSIGAAFTLARTGETPVLLDTYEPVAAEKEKKLVEHRGPIGPGISALAAASTEVIVAAVLETNPRKAVEGARDTVKLGVTRSLLGRLAPGDEIGVYYHLLWRDEESTILEPDKFLRGMRYLIFLKSHVEDRGGNEGKRVVYALTDQWLAVRPDNVVLIREVEAAIKLHHGNANGEWSKPVGPLEARLVLTRGEPSNGTPIIVTRLDVRNVSGGDNTVEFAPKRSEIKWTVTDAEGKPVATSTPPGNWLPTPDLRLKLASKESGQLNLRVTGAGIAKDRGGHLELASDAMWLSEKGAKGPYHLSGTITVPATGEGGKWNGTLELPKVRIPLGVE